MAPKIAFYHAKPYEVEFFSKANSPYQFEIKFFEERLNIDTCILADGCPVVCIFVNDVVTKEIIDKLCRLRVKLLALRSAGYNHVDLKSAKGKITVVRVPDYSPHAVAEHAVAMMLALNRKIPKAYFRVRDNNFSIAGLMGFDMYQKTAGIIGAGKIGKAVIEILKGFGMKIIAYDIDSSQVQQAQCPLVDLDTLYKESDIISLHCPLTPQTQHMINKEALGKMKEGVMLINTGRGALIDSKALIDSLKAKKIGAAGLDVYEEESHFFYEDLSSSFISDDTLARLQTFPNVLITSHQGFFTKEAMEGIASTTLKNVQDFFNGKPLKNEISIN